jgi:hypothetical protein
MKGEPREARRRYLRSARDERDWRAVGNELRSVLASIQMKLLRDEINRRIDDLHRDVVAMIGPPRCVIVAPLVAAP